MSKKTKKAMSMLLVVTLVAVVAVGGMLAYLTDSKSDVNVMTLGNVSIEQHEYQRVQNDDGTYPTDTIDGKTSYVLEPFVQGKDLLPIVGDPSEPGNSPAYAGWDDTIVRMTQVDSYGSMQVFAGKNAQDKFVTVENTGKSDAYVHTIVAIEVGSTNGSLVKCSARAGSDTAPWVATDIGIVSIDGNNYRVVEYVYRGASDVNRHVNGVLPAGETTYPNLCQVYLKHNATNDDMVAIDGNKNGTLDILVLSQAIQTSGFANATEAFNAEFGPATEENVPGWFDEPTIPQGIRCYQDTKDVRGQDGSYVVIKDFNAENIIHFGDGSDVELDLNGKTITADKKEQYAMGAQYGSKLHLTGNGTLEMGKGFMTNKGGAEITIDAGTYRTTVAGGPLNGIKHTSLAQNDSKIIINGGTFTTDVPDAVLFFATSNGVIEVNGGFFENTANDTPDLFSMGTNKGNTNRVIFTGGTFVNWNPLEDRMCYTGEWPENGLAAFSGPWMIVMDGYKVVSETQANGDVWYSVVPK